MRGNVCVCVCVYVSEREKERKERQTDGQVEGCDKGLRPDSSL